MGGEDPVVAFGGDATGEVGVGGDDRRPVPVLAELGGLVVGEGGSQGSDADVRAAGGEGDGDGVQGAFDDDGGDLFQLKCRIPAV